MDVRWKRFQSNVQQRTDTATTVGSFSTHPGWSTPSFHSHHFSLSCSRTKLTQFFSCTTACSASSKWSENLMIFILLLFGKVQETMELLVILFSDSWFCGKAKHFLRWKPGFAEVYPCSCFWRIQCTDCVECTGMRGTGEAQARDPLSSWPLSPLEMWEQVNNRPGELHLGSTTTLLCSRWEHTAKPSHQNRDSEAVFHGKQDDHMMLGSLTSQQWGTRSGFSCYWFTLEPRHRGQPRSTSWSPPHSAGSNPSSAVLHHSWSKTGPGEARRKRKKGSFAFQWLSQGPPGPAIPVTTVITKGSACARAPAPGWNLSSPGSIQASFTAQKRFFPRHFLKKKYKSLKTPVVNEQLVLSQTQCGHVQTCHCPSMDPRPNGASLFCQTPLGAGLQLLGHTEAWGAFSGMFPHGNSGSTHKNKCFTSK